MKNILYCSIHDKKSLFKKFGLPTIGYYKILDTDNYWEANSCCNKFYHMIAFIDGKICISFSGLDPDGLPRIDYCPFCGKKPVVVKGIRDEHEEKEVICKAIYDMIR